MAGETWKSHKITTRDRDLERDTRAEIEQVRAERAATDDRCACGHDPIEHGARGCFACSCVDFDDQAAVYA